MSWKRMDYGIPTKQSAELSLDKCRREFPKDKFRLTQNKGGYSILIWIPPKPQSPKPDVVILSNLIRTV